MSLRPESEGSRRGRKASARTGARRSRFSLELLEDRIAPAVFNVNSTADILQPPAGTVTLRSAIQQANNTPGGNTINLTIPGTYKITIPAANNDNNATGDFDILPSGGNLTIVNISGGTVFVDGNHLSRVFDINPQLIPTKFTVTLQGFTVQNGVASPGDGAAGSGGGIRDQGTASLTLTNMTVTNNIATADGGGVSMENTASTPWTLTVNQSTISNNRAGDAGGGIDTDGSGTVNINQGTEITGNTCANQGAGIWLDGIQAGTVMQGANLNVTGTLVADNKALTAAGGFGGGIGNAGNGTVTIQNSSILRNSSGGVGGGFGDQNNQGKLVVMKSIFLGNVAVGDGGGIQEGGSLVAVVDTEVKDNVSGGVGGGLFANSFTMTVLRSTFADNTATGGGGGIELETNGIGANTSSITNSTITGNIALFFDGANGGGINAPADFTGAVALLNVTINANFATNGGGVFWAGTAGSTFTVQNAIIAQNFAGTGPDANNPAGTFTDRGGNLIGIAGAGGGNTGFTAASQSGTLAKPLNPLLGPLGDNGGPAIGAPGFTMTLETEAPLPGSPAINNGTLNGAPPHDERGFPSVVVAGKINVGAVSQAQGPTGTAVTAGGQAGVTATANTTTGADTATAMAAAAGSAGPILTNTDAPSLVVTTPRDVVDSTDGLTSLREAIAYANSHPGPDTITFDPAVFGTRPRTIRLTGGLLVLTDPATTTILGPGARRLTVRGNGRSRVFDIKGGSAALSGLTIAGSLRNEGAPMKLTRVLVRHNTARSGGGLFHTDRAPHTHVNVRDHAARVGGLADLGAP